MTSFMCLAMDQLVAGVMGPGNISMVQCKARSALSKERGCRNSCSVVQALQPELPGSNPSAIHYAPESLQKNSLQLMPLKTFPAAIRGVIQSELNYSVILQWVVTMDPEPVLSWTFNGVPCGMGEKLFIRRLSWEQLGTYMCIATNSKKQLVSEPVTISLPEPIAQPTEAEPMEPDPTLSLSGGSAIGLLVAGILGAGTLIAGVCFTIIQSLRTDRQRIGICS
ncbi:immunoglobulin superfamily member 23 [Macaca thibetana thibetana]|uniref:immunoglobulin superfamily member 23 n=1 Tax=Macaca thibetana thibetana TaxID=257877 RepID=UPI0021BC8E1A|nr:immunoglobulin superfamily member 23 [Macaca thibetana thibetana]